MRFLLGLLAITALAACGGGGSKTDLPADQHDLGHGVSVAVRQVIDPAPDTGWDGHVVVVDLEYFNRTGETIQTPPGQRYGAELHDTDGRKATLIMLPSDTYPRRGDAVPAKSSVRGWEGFQLPGTAKPADLLLYNGDGDVAATVTL